MVRPKQALRRFYGDTKVEGQFQGAVTQLSQRFTSFWKLKHDLKTGDFLPKTV